MTAHGNSTGHVVRRMQSTRNLPNMDRLEPSSWTWQFLFRWMPTTRPSYTIDCNWMSRDQNQLDICVYPCQFLCAEKESKISVNSKMIGPSGYMSWIPYLHRQHHQIGHSWFWPNRPRSIYRAVHQQKPFWLDRVFVMLESHNWNRLLSME